MTTAKRPRSLKRPVIIFLVGSTLIGTFKVFVHYHVGEFGASADIGGGLLPLTGLVLVLVGVVQGCVVLLARLRQRGSSSRT